MMLACRRVTLFVFCRLCEETRLAMFLEQLNLEVESRVLAVVFFQLQIFYCAMMLRRDMHFKYWT